MPNSLGGMVVRGRFSYWRLDRIALENKRLAGYSGIESLSVTWHAETHIPTVRPREGFGKRTTPYGIHTRRILYVHFCRGDGVHFYTIQRLTFERRRTHEMEIRSAGIITAFPRIPGNESASARACVVHIRPTGLGFMCFIRVFREAYGRWNKRKIRIETILVTGDGLRFAYTSGAGLVQPPVKLAHMCVLYLMRHGWIIHLARVINIINY